MKEIWGQVDFFVKIGFAIAILLIIISFIMPPVGVISSEVLLGAAEIEGGCTLLYFLEKLPEYIRLGASVSMKKGDVEVSVGKSQD